MKEAIVAKEMALEEFSDVDNRRGKNREETRGTGTRRRKEETSRKKGAFILT